MRLRNKRGFTLVEVLAATIILVTITIAIIFSLTFSQDMVQTNSSRDAYAAEVQTAADVIMNFINAGYTSPGDIESASGDYMYLDAASGFSSEIDNIQFQIESAGEPGFYKIIVRIYYGFTNDREMVELVAYAHSDW